MNVVFFLFSKITYNMYKSCIYIVKTALHITFYIEQPAKICSLLFIEKMGKKNIDSSYQIYLHSHSFSIL